MDIKLNPMQQGQTPGRGPSAGKSGAGGVKYNEPVAKDAIRDTWVRKSGVKHQVEQTLQTFGTDRVFKSAEGPDLVEKSGNRLERGLLKTARLGQSTGRSEIDGNPFISNNNILEAWEKAPTSERRKVILDTTKRPEERRSEALKPPQEQRGGKLRPMQQSDLDIQA